MLVETVVTSFLDVVLLVVPYVPVAAVVVEVVAGVGAGGGFVDVGGGFVAFLGLK